MATRREELVAAAARLFAERGYHGTSMADLADAMGVQKGSLYSLTGSKQDLLVRHRAGRRGRLPRRRSIACPTTRSRSSASAPRCAPISPSSPPRCTPRPCSPASGGSSTSRRATAFREERRRYEERWRALLREAAERGALRADLDGEATVLLVLSAANWADTWIRPETDTDALADRFFAILVDGVRGYAPGLARVNALAS